MNNDFSVQNDRVISQAVVSTFVHTLNIILYYYILLYISTFSSYYIRRENDFPVIFYTMNLNSEYSNFNTFFEYRKSARNLDNSL